MVHIFADCIGGALVPVSAGVGLLGRENIDKSLPERVEFVGLLDMFVQRRRIELREQVYVVVARIYTVAYWNIDEPVFAGKRHCRLATVFC